MSLLNYINNEEQEINYKLKEYYISSKNINVIISKFSKSLNIILTLLGFNKSMINGN